VKASLSVKYSVFAVPVASLRRQNNLCEVGFR
jgi:hypothetical protein